MHKILDIQFCYYKCFFGLEFSNLFLALTRSYISGHVTMNVSVGIKDHELLLTFKFGSLIYKFITKLLHIDTFYGPPVP